MTESNAITGGTSATEPIASKPAQGGMPGKEVAVPAPAVAAGTGDGGIPLPDLPVVKVNGPADVVNLVPWLLGFRPGARDLVVIGTVPPRGRVQLTFRYDLPGQPSPLFAALTRRAVAALAAQGCTRALIVGYGPHDLVAPAVAVVREAVKASGLKVAEAVRAEGGRCWCLCKDPACSPAGGIPCGPADSPVIAAFQAAGAPAPLASRAVLAATLAPVTGAEAEAMRAAMRKAEARAERLIRRGYRPGREQARSPLVTSGIRAVAAALRACQAGGAITSHGDLAWLIRVLRRIEVRDEAWLRMDPAHREAHRRLWTGLAQLATGRDRAAPASLLALVAWQDGNGALANVALDQAQAADPGYTMARLLREAIGSGAPPEKADPAGLRRAARAESKRRTPPAATRSRATAARRPTTTRKRGTPVEHDPLAGFGKVTLDRLKLAADVLLSEAGTIPDTLEVELVLYRERLERTMLLPGKPEKSAG